ncbi:GIN domain-containing protein, partial [Duncaniella muris]
KMTDHKFDVSSDFDSIISKGFVDVVFTQSDKEDDFEVRGRLPENLIKKMNIEVSGGTLYISMKSGSYENIVVHGEAPAIYVSNKTLKDVSSSGSGDFTVNGNLNASDGFSVRSSGSSDFKCGVIKADSKDVTVSTSDAVRRTSCRSTDCKSSGTKARRCAVFTF